jgi:hypothetical protein
MWLEMSNIQDVSPLSKFNYTFNAIPVKVLMGCCIEFNRMLLNIFMQEQGLRI